MEINQIVMSVFKKGDEAALQDAINSHPLITTLEKIGFYISEVDYNEQGDGVIQGWITLEDGRP